MRLPDFPEITASALQEVAASLGATDAKPLPTVGIFNAIFAVGENLILRIPRDHPAFIEAAQKEALAAPAARAAGVRTPELVRFDDTREFFSVPYTVYERVHGNTLGLLDSPTDFRNVWRDVGRDLAKLHSGVEPQGAIAALTKETLPDPLKIIFEMVNEGYLTSLEASWLSGWLERLWVQVREFSGSRFLHGDMQSANILINNTAGYLALLDWGAAGWGDPAEDFAGVPLRVVPYMLDGYREMSPLDADDTAEARILYRHLQIALFLLRRPAMPGKSWAERPFSVFLETMNFLIKEERWRRLVT